jgi:hypothetical protein
MIWLTYSAGLDGGLLDVRIEKQTNTKKAFGAMGPIIDRSRAMKPDLNLPRTVQYAFVSII